MVPMYILSSSGGTDLSCSRLVSRACKQARLMAWFFIFRAASSDNFDWWRGLVGRVVLLLTPLGLKTPLRYESWSLSNVKNSNSTVAFWEMCYENLLLRFWELCFFCTPNKTIFRQFFPLKKLFEKKICNSEAISLVGVFKTITVAFVFSIPSKSTNFTKISQFRIGVLELRSFCKKDNPKPKNVTFFVQKSQNSKCWNPKLIPKIPVQYIYFLKQAPKISVMLSVHMLNRTGSDDLGRSRLVYC